MTIVKVRDFDGGVLMHLLGLKTPRGNRLKSLAPPVGVKPVATFGIKKGFYLEDRLSWIMGIFAFLCSGGYGPLPCWLS